MTKAKNHLGAAIELLKLIRDAKAHRLTDLSDLNVEMTSLAHTEWDTLIEEIKYIQRDIELLEVIKKNR